MLFNNHLFANDSQLLRYSSQRVHPRSSVPSTLHYITLSLINTLYNINYY